VGAWVPEPLLTDERDPGSQVELADSLSQALLMALERLTPVERAVFLLRDVFDYEYAEIAEIVERSEDNCRQLASRARKHVEEGRPRFHPSVDERERLADRFFAAAERGELEELEELLAADAVAYGDGGGKVPALTRPLSGSREVARLMLTLFRQIPRMGVGVERTTVNGDPGLIARDSEGRVVSVLSIDIGDGKVRGVRSVVNPDKLGHLGEVADVRALLRRRSG
jgi:RNA polymerase sigma-70 factor (ECF subfamily)